MKGIFSFMFLVCYAFWGYCQTTDTLKTITLNGVTVTAYKDKLPEETSLNISTLRIDSLNALGNYNLTDLIAKTPGIRMLSTGLAISKPVIRGLYGNRVLVLLSGLKFDNLQWQEEHGLGLSDFGLSKVELIKGPMSVLYGTEALGGIVNLIEEKKPELNKKESELSLKLNSNTLGGIIQAGIKANKGSNWYRIRVGIENNADYSDGNNTRVLNSRFDGYYLKGTWGFKRKNWTSTNNFMSTYNRFGFIFNDVYTFITPDERWSRKLDVKPAHLVLLNVLSSENKFKLKNGSKLNLNVGIQSNERMENEGGGAISLNMHLLTFQYILKWETQLFDNSRLVISHLGSFENNTNYGSRKIVPDANLQESNISAFLETTIQNKLIIENGLSVGEKWIKTNLTATVNTPDKEIQPFSKFSPYYNFFSGITYFPSNSFNVKFNVASGVRIPNLAELSSNGLHEGIFTYEIGDPLLKNEQNISFNIITNTNYKFFQFSLNPFYNIFYNYVYLAPTSEDWFGFPVYRYLQQNATQYGVETSLTFKPTKQLRARIAYEGMISKTEDGNFTPYIPAQKITPSIYYTINEKSNKSTYLFTNADYYFAQDNVAPNEITTPSYWLWDIGASTTFSRNGKRYSISLTGNNLLNAAYHDHLSRFKYFGILNMGRNITLSFKIRFTGSTKSN